MIGEVRKHPLQVKQVINALKKKGLVQTCLAVMKKLDAYSLMVTAPQQTYTVRTLVAADRLLPAHPQDQEIDDLDLTPRTGRGPHRYACQNTFTVNENVFVSTGSVVKKYL